VGYGNLDSVLGADLMGGSAGQWMGKDLTLKLFCEKSSVLHLPTGLAPSGGGTEEQPVFIFNGKDAAAGGWPTWRYPLTPVTFNRVSVGTQPEYNWGSPLLGPNDDSVRFKQSDYFAAPDTSFGQITTEDFIPEIIFQAPEIQTSLALASTRVGTNGWLLYTNSNRVICVIDDSSGSAIVTSGIDLIPGAFYHAIFFMDRSGFGQCYINGIVSGAAVDLSARQSSLNSGTAMGIGARSSGGIPTEANIAYLAIWAKGSWLSSHLNDVTAKQRFLQAIGYWPQVAKGSPMPEVATRAGMRFLPKVEGAVTRLYPVGGEWLRLASRLDDNGEEFFGGLIEPDDEQDFNYSEDFSDVSWTKTRCTLSVNGEVAPDGEQTADGIIGTAVEGTHFVVQSAIGGTEDVFTAFIKAGNKNWAKLDSGAGPNDLAYFNLATCEVGTVGSGVTNAYIKDWGNGWCRCIVVYPGAGLHTHSIHAADADNDDSFTGDGVTVNIWIWGATHSDKGLGYPTTYIRSVGAPVSSVKDQLRFKGDDGNLGGVGSEKQGVAVFRALLPAADYVSFKYFMALSDGGSSNNRVIFSFLPSGNLFRNLIVESGVTTVDQSSSTDIGDGLQHELRTPWKTNDVRIKIDGEQEARDTVCAIPDDLDQIDVASTMGQTLQPGGLLQIKLFSKFRP
jgi:hypothetical protein